MNQETNKDKAKLAGKLLKIMKAIEKVDKAGRNTFDDYNYQKENDIKLAVRNALIDNGVFALHSVVDSKTDQYTSAKGKPMFMVDVTYRIEFIDTDTGVSLVSDFRGHGSDRGDKGIYKAITGAIKYNFINNFAIPSETMDPEGESPSMDGKVTKNYGNKYPPYVKPVDSIYGLSLEDAQKLSKATPEKVRTLIKELGLSRGFYHIGDFMSLHVRDEETMLRALSCFEDLDKAVPAFMGGAKWSILDSIKAIKEHTDKGTLKEFEKECIAGTAVPF